jgi:cytochrome c
MFPTWNTAMGCNRDARVIKRSGHLRNGLDFFARHGAMSAANQMGFAMRLWKCLPLLLLTATGVCHAADAKRGAAVFMRCEVCHNAERDGGNGLGPNLFGVVGRKAASLPGFSYSPALRKSGIVWTNIELKQWVAHPAMLVPGTRMVFAVLSNPSDVNDLVAYLDTLK